MFVVVCRNVSFSSETYTFTNQPRISWHPFWHPKRGQNLGSFWSELLQYDGGQAYPNAIHGAGLWKPTKLGTWEGGKYTPRKINIEHNHGGLVPMIFLSKWVICRFQPLIFQGVLNIPAPLSVWDFFWWNRFQIPKWFLIQGSDPNVSMLIHTDSPGLKGDTALMCVIPDPPEKPWK